MRAEPAEGWRRARGLALAALALSLAAACRRPQGESLPVARVVPLGSAAYRTLAVDPEGGLWLGAPGVLARFDTLAGARPVPVGGEASPSLLGWAGGRAYARAGARLLVVEGERVRAERGGVGESDPVLLDVGGRWVLHGARSGAVLAYDPTTLEPLWAWAALALPTTALAASPEGDRLYQAVGSPEGAPRVLFRELQTGRTLASVSFADPFVALSADGAGVLTGVVAEGARGSVMALRPRGAELRPLWRASLAPLELPEGGRLRLVRSARRVAVLGGGSRTGLRVLDAETGRVLGSESDPPLDAAFASDGALLLLYPGEIRVVR